MNIAFTIIEILGFISFSISGAITAIDKENDILGVVFLSVITSFGGGIMRDIIIGNIVPVFFRSYLFISICVGVSLLTFLIAALFKKQYVRNEKLVNSINNYFDAAGLGLFAVSGAKICIDLGHTNPLLILLMGVMSCCGGSMLRDVIMREIPVVLRKRIYILAAFAGVLLYYLLYQLGVDNVVAMTLSALTVFVIRICATVFKWNMPKAIDFSKIKDEDIQ